MTTFVLIPGAGGAGFYWDELVAELDARGHLGIAVDFRADDPALGLPEYAGYVDAAVGEHRDVVLVAQSLGGFTAPMIERTDALVGIVLLNAMIPLPGETPGQWWNAVGSEPERLSAAQAGGYSRDFDLTTYFLHDVPERLWPSMAAHHRDPAGTPFGQPCTFDTWPDVPIHVLSAAADRFFPLALQTRVARERLGLEVDVMPGGHLVAKSRPAEVADRLVNHSQN